MAGHLWLIGMMGAGKTAAGRELAARREVAFADTDEIVAERTGCTVAQLWGTRGEQAFRDMEAAVVLGLASEPEVHVVATGGGAVLRPESAAAMRASGRVIWLTAATAILAGRVGDTADRPLLAEPGTESRLCEILGQRRRIYGETAHAEVATDRLSLPEVVDELERLWSVT